MQGTSSFCTWYSGLIFSLSHTSLPYSLASARFLLCSTSPATKAMVLSSLLCHDTPLFWWIRSLKLGSFHPLSFCRAGLPVPSLPCRCYGADLWLINPTAELKWGSSFFLSVFHIREFSYSELVEKTYSFFSTENVKITQRLPSPSTKWWQYTVCYVCGVDLLAVKWCSGISKSGFWAHVLKTEGQVLQENTRNGEEIIDTWHIVVRLGNWYQSCSICLF